MSNPRPYVVSKSGEKGSAPAGAVPIDLYGVAGGEAGEVAWDDVTGKPSAFPPVIGTSATDAKAGNYTPAWSDVTGKPSNFPPATHSAVLVIFAADATNGIDGGNAQVVLSALAARVKALEDAAPEG